MTWETVAAVIAALGGLELIKYIVHYLTRRKTDARIAETQADAEEFHILREQIEFLQEQLSSKEERFAEQTAIVRRLNTEVLDGARREAALELELAVVRCEDRPCPFRVPPTAYTQPRGGLTIEEYQARKDKSNTKTDTKAITA